MQRHSRHLWYFVTLAILVHVALAVTITVQKLYEEPEPKLSSKFIKRRPLRQPVLQRRLARPHPVRSLRRSVLAPRSLARSVIPRSSAPPHPQLLTSREVVPALPVRSVPLARGVPGTGRLRSVAVEVAL